MLPSEYWHYLNNKDAEKVDSYKDYFSKTSDAPGRKMFKESAADLTDKQARRYLDVSFEATRATLNANSDEEVAKIYSNWMKDIGEVLLPIQSVYLYQKTVARNGLVFFLTRPDVAAEMRITDKQRRKIIGSGKAFSENVFQRELEMRSEGLANVLQALPDKKRKKVFDLLGMSEEKSLRLISRYKLFGAIDSRRNYQQRKAPGNRNDKQKRLKKALNILELPDRYLE